MCLSTGECVTHTHTYTHLHTNTRMHTWPGQRLRGCPGVGCGRYTYISAASHPRATLQPLPWPCVRACVHAATNISRTRVSAANAVGGRTLSWCRLVFLPACGMRTLGRSIYVVQHPVHSPLLSAPLYCLFPGVGGRCVQPGASSGCTRALWPQQAAPASTAARRMQARTCRRHSAGTTWCERARRDVLCFALRPHHMGLSF